MTVCFASFDLSLWCNDLKSVIFVQTISLKVSRTDVFNLVTMTDIFKLLTMVTMYLIVCLILCFWPHLTFDL